MTDDDLWGDMATGFAANEFPLWVSTRAKTSRFFFAGQKSGDSLATPEDLDDHVVVGETQRLHDAIFGEGILSTDPSSNGKTTERASWSAFFASGAYHADADLAFAGAPRDAPGIAGSRFATDWSLTKDSPWSLTIGLEPSPAPVPKLGKGYGKTNVPAVSSPEASPVLTVKVAPSETEERTAKSSGPDNRARDQGTASPGSRARKFYAERSAAVVPFTPAEQRRPQKDSQVRDAAPATDKAGAGAVKIQVPCKFFLEGFCANGDNCRYVHAAPGVPAAVDENVVSAPHNPLEATPTEPASHLVMPLLPSGVSSWDPSGDLCTFHVSNECKYGEHCRYLHGRQCQYCLTNVLHPLDEERAREHLQTCAAALNAAVGPTVPMLQSQDEITCGICMNQTRTLGRKYGLLEKCEHVFCFECVREYRGGDLSGRTIRNCPICFTESALVVPSFVLVTDPQQRKDLFEKHVRRLAAIPCKHYNYGEATCPFGSECYYAHTDRTRVLLAETKPRART